jgi:hypothetical protein
MEKDFKAVSEKRTISRREFLSAGALAAGLLVCGKALAENGLRQVFAELRDKFREMERYGIDPAVCWTDPTMRKLLSTISLINNSSVSSGKTERFAVFGSNPEEQYRSLNSFIGKSGGSPFCPASLAALEQRCS